MKILIIGGTGFIGQHLLPLLVPNHKVWVLHRGSTTTFLPKGVERIRGDRRQLGRLQSTWNILQPDVVVDLIPYFAQDAWSLLQTFAGLSHRVVLLSSGDVYRAYERFKDNEPEMPQAITEAAALRQKLFPYRGMDPNNELTEHYDKILAERLLMSQTALDWTILRLGALYGPGDSQRKLQEFIAPMLNGEPYLGLNREQAHWRWTRAYVKDVAHGIRLAIEHKAARNRVYNLGEEEPLTQGELVELLRRITGWRGQVHLGADAPLPANFKQHLVLDTQRIRRELGYREIYTSEEGLQQTVAQWSAAHGS